MDVGLKGTLGKFKPRNKSGDTSQSITSLGSISLQLANVTVHPAKANIMVGTNTSIALILFFRPSTNTMTKTSPIAEVSIVLATTNRGTSAELLTTHTMIPISCAILPALSSSVSSVVKQLPRRFTTCELLTCVVRTEVLPNRVVGVYLSGIEE